MTALLPWVPAFPLAGFVLLALLGRRLSERQAGVIGAGSIGLAALAAALACGGFLTSGEPAMTFALYTWFDLGGLAPGFAFHLDGLAVVMLGVITGVGFLIHVFAAAYMHGEPSYARFFAYMNLFVAAMLVLVLADNLVLLYLGWEGVGVCSYLLIGFWYKNPDNGWAARKAFIVTRVGDTLMAVGLFLLFRELGTLDIRAVNAGAAVDMEPGGATVTAICLLLLGGAAGKSAQVPLHTWLPDAMAGPTPVSALIHAATMVTAGVYLIARLHPLFETAPLALDVVAVVGLVTLLVAGLAALGQHDIKRILAYSTISQIGYMVLALGIGAYAAAIDHLMTHAFFKALLFLAAGAVIHHVHEQQDIRQMGGLRRVMPITFATFAIGSAALAALPVVTAGFWTKDAILIAAFDHAPWLWAGGLIGALLTSVYIFRCVFIAFFGEAATGEREHLDGEHPDREHLGPAMAGVLIILAALSLFGALVPQPLEDVLPHGAAHHGAQALMLQAISAVVALIGVGLAWWWFFPGRTTPAWLTAGGFMAWLRHGLGFDALYGAVFTRPLTTLARANRDDVIDWLPRGITTLAANLHGLLAVSQSGNLRWYLAGIGGGVVVLVAIALVGA